MLSLPSLVKSRTAVASLSPSFCLVSHLPTSSFAASSLASPYTCPARRRTAQPTTSPRSACMMLIPSRWGRENRDAHASLLPAFPTNRRDRKKGQISPLAPAAHFTRLNRLTLPSLVSFSSSVSAAI